MTVIVRRDVLAAIGAALVESGCLGEPPADVLTPEQFGAKGDGVTNDTPAFNALAAAVMRRGGGKVVLQRAVYVVGQQQARAGAGILGATATIFSVTDLPGSLTISGNGATLRCAPGLRYGSFDPVTGQRLATHTQNYDRRTIATPYHAMISIERCQGAVEITDVMLDGNNPALRIGGGYGDVGIQIGAIGIVLRDNAGDEILRRIRSHRHAQDGLMIDGLSRTPPGVRHIAEDVTCEDNGRQGCSIIGGRSWRFTRCTFARSGRGPVSSPPAAGLDIEAEGGKANRDHSFVDCAFIDNAGCGMVADSGDTADLSFTRCRFVGTSAASVWPNKPFVRFHDCRFVGTVLGCFGADPARATRFIRCLFTDDPAQSPTRAVYRQGRLDGSLADLASVPNVLFDRCRFLAVGGATLPWSTAVIYRDCTFQQRGKSPSYPRGTFAGRNTISAPVDLTGSHVSGTLIVNGVRHP